MSLNVVYLDDEAELCEAFADNFNSESVSVKTFSDPMLAVQFIRQNPPDLLFVDYRLPGTTGDQIAMLIDKRIPKVLVSGELEVHTKAEFLECLAKPLPWQRIEEILKEHLLLKMKGLG